MSSQGISNCLSPSWGSLTKRNEQVLTSAFMESCQRLALGRIALFPKVLFVWMKGHCVTSQGGCARSLHTFRDITFLPQPGAQSLGGKWHICAQPDLWGHHRPRTQPKGGPELPVQTQEGSRPREARREHRHHDLWLL